MLRTLDDSNPWINTQLGIAVEIFLFAYLLGALLLIACVVAARMRDRGVDAAGRSHAVKHNRPRFFYDYEDFP